MGFKSELQCSHPSDLSAHQLLHPFTHKALSGDIPPATFFSPIYSPFIALFTIPPAPHIYPCSQYILKMYWRVLSRMAEISTQNNKNTKNHHLLFSLCCKCKTLGEGELLLAIYMGNVTGTTPNFPQFLTRRSESTDPGQPGKVSSCSHASLQVLGKLTEFLGWKRP